MAMEFWGVEVKSGEALRVDPGKDMLAHISQVTIGVREENRTGEFVHVYLNINNQKFVLGRLSHDKFPQLTTEIVLEKEFWLSHSWNNGSVYFTGYKVDARDDDGTPDFEDNGDAMSPAINGSVKGSDHSKAGATSKEFNLKEPKKNAKPVEVEEDGTDEDSDIASEDASDDEPEPSKKRPLKDALKTTAYKKLKSAGLQEADVKKSGGHIPTLSGYSNQQTIKLHSCKSCGKSFTSEAGLQSHTKAKHCRVA